MFSSNNYIKNFNEIPSKWIFENYLNIKLDGTSTKIKSVFNDESVPSMFIYLDDNNVYKFKDFSSGNHGEAINLVMIMYDLDFISAFDMIKEDFLKSNYDKSKVTNDLKFTITYYNTLDFKKEDLIYWAEYNINYKKLLEHNIKRINYEVSNGKRILKFNNPYIYGYFDKKDVLKRIYQPKVKEAKFIVIDSNYIQNSDFCKREDYLLILSSMKDGLALSSIKDLKFDFICPSSETLYLNEETINIYKERYEKILVIFDNDKMGIKSMNEYKELYNIEPVFLLKDKDIANMFKSFGPKEAIQYIIPKINSKLNKNV